ncbi:exo-beta-N-acetylmuramidase NamZ family protein [Persicitalea jodogahamensis]|uniref:DUF1343 domain-containing protein n=1 Tax=Persicitalea jodogahamensis TaxID=402147 RepID=A0A8J3D4F7_9BACT|nr:DUF1343 domain-containing protein [Persicitalea jodogahamensis]GHB72189.1 hypothetical protein GCM10007390_27800 [Persicitalea jodogahamensis]
MNHVLSVLLAFMLSTCGNTPQNDTPASSETTSQEIKTDDLKLGIDRTGEWVPLLTGKRVGLVVNHTTLFSNGTHLADSLLALGVNIQTIFAPEHGFRGQADAGATIKDGKDAQTGLPIVSLYGKNKKPSAEQLKDIDVVIFDIQDVGVRYYTYPSTMHYVMEACAENGKPCIILDRPNPNGDYVDGPVLDPKFKSFVGMNPVPVVHGLTSAELALMINGEGWLEGKKSCDLTVVPCTGYNHRMVYELPVKPSPNLPNLQSIRLYPSICLFEPTIVSVGRGTDTQFQVIGAPNKVYGPYEFTPVDKPGAQNPPNKGKVCYGLDLRDVDTRQEGFTLKYVLDFYNKTPDKSKFFTSADFFDKLAGTDMIRKMMVAGKSEAEIRAAFTPELEEFKEKREKYLLYE